jgi:hypothetical protein
MATEVPKFLSDTDILSQMNEGSLGYDEQNDAFMPQSIQNLSMSGFNTGEREASLSFNPYSNIGYNRPQTEDPSLTDLAKGFTGSLGAQGQGYMPLGDLGSASFNYNAAATVGQHGLSGRANVGASADLNITDRLNLNPYANVNIGGGGVNTSGGAKLSYTLKNGGKVPKQYQEGGEVPDGMVEGASHEQGGVPIEAEGGERIFSQEATVTIEELAAEKKYKELGKFVAEEMMAQDERDMQEQQMQQQPQQPEQQQMPQPQI